MSTYISTGAEDADRTQHRWAAVLSVALMAAAFCSTEFMPVGLLRYIASGLSVSEGVAGLTVTAPGLLAAVAAPLVTVFVRQHDRRLVLWALGALLVVSNLIAALAVTFPMLLLARVLFGVGLGGFWAIGAGLGERLVRAASVPRATAVIFAGVSVGMLVGGAAGALIGELLGWRWAFGFTAALAAISLAAQFALLPSLKVERRVRASDLWGILATSNGRVGLLAMMLILIAQFAAYTYITPFLSQQAHFGGKVISVLLFGYTLVGMLGNFIGGAFAGRNLKSTLSSAMVCIGVPLLLLPLRSFHPAEVLVLLALWGLAYGALPVVLQMWMAKASPNATEGSMALFVANFQISIALGAYMGGWLVDTNGVVVAMLFASGLSVVGLAVARLGGAIPTTH
jgi:predicted MFS family arabinose efflux permease